MDAERKPIATPEDAFIASDRYIEWRKAWDELRFRTMSSRVLATWALGVEVSAGSLWGQAWTTALCYCLTKLHAQDRFVSVLPHAICHEGKTTELIQA